MITLQVPSRSHAPPARIFGIAGHRLSADTPLPELEAFSLVGQRLRHGSQRVDSKTFTGPNQHVFRGAAELGPRRYSLDCSLHDEAYELCVSGLGRFTIDCNGERIAFEPDSESLTGFAEIFLGPALTLALALHGVWCMHASAVAYNGRALVFLGTSGVGKSTLARLLPRVSSSDLRCVADDVVPLCLNSVSLSAGGARALPRFPQLKYPSNRQPGVEMPSSLPLGGIYILDTDIPVTGGLTIEPMTGYAAVLALIRHTHSARLFSRDLLRSHTDFCAQLASRIPVRRLAYPKRQEILPHVAEVLRLEHTTEAAPTVARRSAQIATPIDHTERNSAQDRKSALDPRGGSLELNDQSAESFTMRLEG